MVDIEATVRSREAAVDLTVEHRFPLGLTPTLPEIWDLYATSKMLSWDPEDVLVRSGWIPDEADQAVRSAAALTWSRRAWVEFPGMAESEALLVRFCLEPGRAIDAKYCLSSRAVEKARSTDACRIIADAYLQYVPGSPSPDLAEVIENDSVRWALHADVHVDALVAGSLCAEALIDLRLWEGVAGATAEDHLRAVLDHMIADKRRQVAFGWAYLDDRVHGSDAAASWGAAADRILRDELRGRRVSALLPAGIGRSALIDAQDLVSDAGLGAVRALDEIELLRGAVHECRVALEERGIALEAATHHEHGEF